MHKIRKTSEIYRQKTASMPLLLSIALFPPIDYSALLLFHPEVRLEAHESYVKQSYRNRYHIAGPNGFQDLSVPVDKAGRRSCPIGEAAVVHHGNWPVVHLRSLDAAYNSSPWYLYFRPDIEHLLLHHPGKLWDFSLQALAVTAKMLKRKWEPDFTVRWEKSPAGIKDLRDAFHPKRTGTALFDGTAPPPYSQVFEHKWGFLPGLSILDLLFNEGPAASGYLAERYARLKPLLF
jgi:hypothetical protein